MGWLQPSKDQKKEKKGQKPQRQYSCSWPAWREHHNITASQYPCCPPWSCWPWNIQHSPYSHIPGQTPQRSHTTRAYEWCRPSKKCEYVAFLNPIEEVFTARWRKVVDRQPSVLMPLLQAMEEACEETDVGAIQGRIRHSRCIAPRCLAREDVACDVDKALWPYPAVRQDAAWLFCLPLFLYIFYWHTLSAIFLFSLLFFGSIFLYFCSLQCKHICCANFALTCSVKIKKIKSFSSMHVYLQIFQHIKTLKIFL